MVRIRHNALLCLSVLAIGWLSALASHAADDKSAEPAGVVPWKRPDRPVVRKLSSQQLDELVTKALGGAQMAPPVKDEQFLRRTSLDLIGRQPGGLQRRPAKAAQTNRTVRRRIRPCR